MLKKHLAYYLSYLDRDIPAGFVVFLVALPLCLGISVASGAPPFSGIIAGVIGGLVVSVLSGSQLSVSGPAAGLTVIVAATIEKFGFNGALLIISLSGLIQLAMGFVGAGLIGAYFPSAVIKGMLAAIGVILMMKQLPYAVGFGGGSYSDLSFLEGDSHTKLSFLITSLKSISPGSAIVAMCSLGILLLWETSIVKRNQVLAMTPGPLAAVLFGTILNIIAQSRFPSLAIAPEHLVSLPPIAGPVDFANQFAFPDFSMLANPQIYLMAATLAFIGSLETLLSLEAVDKLDPLKRIAPPNRELAAQGVGNLMSGLIGGLPITAVIVRSSANIDAGAHTKVASIVHGCLLLLSVILFSTTLNMVPLASLAAVLILTGYKLAKPTLVIEQYKKGFDQFAPFVITIAAIMATDLLKGMAVGMAAGIFFVLHANHHSAITLTRDGRNYLLRLQKDVSFLNKAPLRNLLEKIEEGGYLMIDGTRADFIDQDILETLEDFLKAATDNDIRVEMKNVRSSFPVKDVVEPILEDDADRVVAFGSSGSKFGA